MQISDETLRIALSAFDNKWGASKEEKLRAALEAALSTDAEPVAWQWRARVKGGVWDAWEDGRYGNSGVVPPSIEIEERALYPAPPAPAGSAQVQDVARCKLVPDDATDAMVAAALKVDWSNENEAATVHNVWHAMLAAAQVQNVVENKKTEHFRTAMLEVENRIRSLRLKELLPGQSANETAIFLSEIADVLKNARDKFSFSLAAAPAAKQGEAE